MFVKCRLIPMIFGDRLSAADSTEPAAWLTEVVNIAPWTVGGLLPEHYESYLLIEPAPSELEGWWSAQRQIVTALAQVLAQFTQTPDESWFAVWEGHGFDSRYHISGAWAIGDEPTAEQRVEIEAELAAARVEGARLTAAIREALQGVPRFSLPYRTYYLLSGHVTDVKDIRWPGEPDRWFRPDLWWPQDRQWFVGTDVDFWCNYVGGSRAMTDAITSRLPGLCHPVTLGEPLREE